MSEKTMRDGECAKCGGNLTTDHKCPDVYHTRVTAAPEIAPLLARIAELEGEVGNLDTALDVIVCEEHRNAPNLHHQHQELGGGCLFCAVQKSLTSVVESESALWRVMPSSYAVSANSDAFEGAGETYRNAYERLAAENSALRDERKRLTCQTGDFRILVEGLWNAAYQQGLEHREVDDEHGTAQRAEAALTSYVNAAYQRGVEAERERAALEVSRILLLHYPNSPWIADIAVQAIRSAPPAVEVAVCEWRLWDGFPDKFSHHTSCNHHVSYITAPDICEHCGKPVKVVPQ